MRAVHLNEFGSNKNKINFKICCMADARALAVAFGSPFGLIIRIEPSLESRAVYKKAT